MNAFWCVSEAVMVDNVCMADGNTEIESAKTVGQSTENK